MKEESKQNTEISQTEARDQELRKWGRDHWSTYAYIETRIVNHGGRPDRDHMRCDLGLHYEQRPPRRREKVKVQPTRMADGSTIEDHDDWSCLEDAIRLGLLIEKEPSGMDCPASYAFTEAGIDVALTLRRHMIVGGGNSCDFRWK